MFYPLGFKGIPGLIGDTKSVSIKGEMGTLGPPGITGFSGQRGTDRLHTV